MVKNGKDGKGSSMEIVIPLPFMDRPLRVSAQGMFLVILALGIAAWFGAHIDLKWSGVF